MIIYYITRLIATPLVHLLTRYRVRGRENIPKNGGVVVVSNHLNLADPPVLGVSMGSRKVSFMAKEELFRSGFMSYLTRRLGAFPVHRGQVDIQAMRDAGKALAEGRALIIFPEGTRSKSGRLQSGSAGAVLIASRNGVPILPAGIFGTEKVKGPFWWLRRPEVTVSFGQPFYPSANGKLNKAELGRLTDYMMERIAELLPVEYRGAPTAGE